MTVAKSEISALNVFAVLAAAIPVWVAGPDGIERRTNGSRSTAGLAVPNVDRRLRIRIAEAPLFGLVQPMGERTVRRHQHGPDVVAIEPRSRIGPHALDRRLVDDRALG